MLISATRHYIDQKNEKMRKAGPNFKSGPCNNKTDPIQISDLFRLCPPPPVRYAPPDTDHVSLHSKSLCKNFARASGACK